MTINVVGHILIASNTTAERMSVVPLLGEFVFDTDSRLLYLGDGVTQGGVLVTADVASLIDLIDSVDGRVDALQDDVELKAYLSQLAAVALSGDYNDLSNLPAFGSAAFADTTEFATAAQGTRADTAVQPGDLSTVATTGSYNDLLDIPVFPPGDVVSVNGKQGVVVLDKTDIGLFNVDNTSDLDKPISTATQAALDNKADANDLFSGSYDDLTNKPTLGTAAATDATDYATAAQGALADTAVQPNDLGSAALADTTDFATASQGTLADSAVQPTDLGTAAYVDSNTFATAAQGALADTSVQPGDLGTAAYVDSNTFATAAQGALADTAVQPEDLATVATTGSYNDLVDTPTIPAAQVNSDWNATGGVEQILNKPTLGTAAATDATDYATAAQGALADSAVQPSDLAEVAVSGDYNDLSNKPTIPAAQVNSDWDATSGVSQILNKPTLGTAAATDASDYATAAQGTRADTAVQPGDLATVATSGDYDDLINKPTIPSVPVTSVAGKIGDVVLDKNDVGLGNVDNTSDLDKPISDATQEALDLKADSADLATVATTGSYNDLLDKPTVVGQVNSDWNATSGVEQILNKPTLATVATTGDYNDLINVPPAPVQSVNGMTGVVVLDKTDIGLSNVDNTSDLSKPISTATQAALDDKLEASDLATVAISGDYSDLTNKPTLSTVATTGAYSDLTGKPTLGTAAATNITDYATAAQGAAADTAVQPEDLATVATTGAYSDLTGKPVIPAAQVPSDWAATSGVSRILNKPTFSSVAITGNYSDLLGKPTIPAAQVPSDWAATSGVTQILNKPTLSTVAITGAYSDLTGKPVIFSGEYDDLSGKPDLSNLATAVQPEDLATVATSGSYNDLVDKPTVAGQVNADWNAVTGVEQILNKPTLATVATTGDYNDLTNKPTPFSGDYGDLSGKPTLGTAAATDATDYATAAQGALADTAVQPADLATVATTGSYNDLLDIPTFPPGNVVSVNGYDGVVVLEKDDLGLSNVDNTADLDKPISTATQAALDEKQQTFGAQTAGTVFAAPATTNDIPSFRSLVESDIPALSAYTPITRSVLAGDGLTDGGDLSGDVTLTLGTPGSLSATSTNSVSSTSHTHAITGFVKIVGDTMTGTLNLPALQGTADILNIGLQSMSNFAKFEYAATTPPANPAFTFIHANDYSSVEVDHPNFYIENLQTGGSLSMGADSTTQIASFNGDVLMSPFSGDFWVQTLSGNILLESEGYTWSTAPVLYIGSGANEAWHEGNLNPGSFAAATLTMYAGSGLLGGGNLTTDRTLSLGTPSTVTGTSTNTVTTDSHTHELSPNLKDWDAIDPSTIVFEGDAPSDGTTYGRKNGEWEPVTGGGTVTSITAGNGMNFSTITGSGAVVLGTPSTLTGSTTNSVTSTSHTHELSANLKLWDAITPSAKQDALGFTPVADAPSDGNTYGRNNGAWTVVTGGGGGGTVTSITAGTGVVIDDTDPEVPVVGLVATLEDWSEIDPSTIVFESDAPSDTLVYGRKDGEWEALDYATTAQGALADSAVQPGDNISTLTNDAGYTTNAGTVTSVALSAPTGFTVGGSPITGTGTLALTYDAGYKGYTTSEASKLSGIAAGATVGANWETNLTNIPANITSWAAIAPSSKADTSALSSYVPLSGGTMTGHLIIGGVGELRIDSTTPASRIIRWTTGGVNRWTAYTNSTSESGSNAGSNFIMRAYADNGATLGDAYSINRATQVVTFNQDIIVAGVNFSAKWDASKASAANLDTNAPTALSDLDTLGGGVATFYRNTSGSASNTPLNSAGLGLYLPYASNAGAQIWFQPSSRRFFYRTMSGGSFLEWNEVWTTNNLTPSIFNHVPLTTSNSSHTFAASQAGTARRKTDTTTRTYTINGSVFSAGDSLIVLNNASSGNIVIAQGSGMTLRLTGSATTGNRTVAPHGKATVYFASATEAYVDGPGVT